MSAEIWVEIAGKYERTDREFLCDFRIAFLSIKSHFRVRNTTQSVAELSPLNRTKHFKKFFRQF